VHEEPRDPFADEPEHMDRSMVFEPELDDADRADLLEDLHELEMFEKVLGRAGVVAHDNIGARQHRSQYFDGLPQHCTCSRQTSGTSNFINQVGLAFRAGQHDCHVLQVQERPDRRQRRLG
jgi:hypothetical protein